MKKSYIVPLLAVFILALIAPVYIHAATPTPKPKIHPTIDSVDANSIIF